ncbi:MAG: ribonuclease III [Sedimentisphaerales bacterium]|nr:ribonuclease III [Sedimentisphaerales bacterium]
MDEATQQQIEKIIGYTFTNKELLAKAFTHSSAVDNRILSNERLEFLGDAVLALVICQALFERFSGYLEGELTKVKSMLVSRGTCARIARKMDLQKFLKVGKGMTSSRALSGSLAAGVLETVIAAIYIDGGLEAARSFILKFFGPIIEQADAEHVQGNFKSLLQQYSQEQFNVTPNYVLLDEKGPDHNKCFELEVAIASQHFPSAWGTNKKEAEQKAAFNALVELGVLEHSEDENAE